MMSRKEAQDRGLNWMRGLLFAIPICIVIWLTVLFSIYILFANADDATDTFIYEDIMKPSNVLTISTGDGKSIKITNDDILTMSKSELQDLVTLISFYSVTNMGDGKVADVFVREFIPRRFIER